MKRGAASARTNRFRWIALAAPVVLLAAFHAALLVRRIADASITRPLILERWAFAAILLAAGFIARRFLAGRRVAIIFWLLVAVLHLAIPTGGGVNHAALLVAALPALIVVSGYAGNSCGAPWPASSLRRIGSIAFTSFRLVHSIGRAPPLF